LVDADFGVGVEGTVNSNEFGMFVVCWVVIVDKNQKLGISSSSAVMLLDNVRKYAESGIGLAKSMKELTTSSIESIRYDTGTNGILTNGLYDRAHEFEDTTRYALAVLISPLYS